MLEFKNVSVTVHKKSILSNVSFSAKEGRITALIGKNGSGKTTLLGCASGMRRYSGEIFISGRGLREMRTVERAKKAAFLPQMMPETALSVRSLVSLGRNPYVGSMGSLSDKDKAAVREAMRLTDTEIFADRGVNTLSGGEKRRAFIAMLLAQEAPLLILDEPTSYLDAASVRQLGDLLRNISAKEGKTILTVMHDLSEAVSLADDIAVMDGGKIIFYGTRSELLQSKVIEETFGVTRTFASLDGKERIFFV